MAKAVKTIISPFTNEHMNRMKDDTVPPKTVSALTEGLSQFIGVDFLRQRPQRMHVDGVSLRSGLTWAKSRKVLADDLGRINGNVSEGGSRINAAFGTLRKDAAKAIEDAGRSKTLQMLNDVIDEKIGGHARWGVNEEERSRVVDAVRFWAHVNLAEGLSYQGQMLAQIYSERIIEVIVKGGVPEGEKGGRLYAYYVIDAPKQRGWEGD